MRYGYFLIERVQREWVTLPGGAELDVPEGRAEDELKAWWEANAHDAEPPGAQDEWDASFAAYRAATTIDEVEGTRGFSTEPVTITRITYPDGHVDDRALGGPPEERIRRRFELHNPPPGQAQERAADYATWRAGPEIAVRKATGWTAELFDGEERVAVDLEARAWTQGFPAQQVAAALNRFASEGWRVLHVSEDRGIYAGPHAGTDSFVTRARYLLGREPA